MTATLLCINHCCAMLVSIAYLLSLMDTIQHFTKQWVSDCSQQIFCVFKCIHRIGDNSNVVESCGQFSYSVHAHYSLHATA